MTDWVLAVDWTRIADIATAVVVVALAMVERHRILPGFCSDFGERLRRFLMLVAGGVLILKLISIRRGLKGRGLAFRSYGVPPCVLMLGKILPFDTGKGHLGRVPCFSFKFASACEFHLVHGHRFIPGFLDHFSIVVVPRMAG